MKTKSTFCTFLSMLFFSGLIPIIGKNESFAQTYDDIYQKGQKLKSEFKYVEALAMFQVLLKTDSANTDYLNNTSILFCKAGNLQSDEKKKFDYFRKAEYLAKKSIRTDSTTAESHYAYALALGRINENASSKEKVASAKMIKTQLETTLKLNPQHAGAYHILGRWHRTIAGFNAFEKLAINMMFGGVPQGGSYDDAIAAFLNAMKYEPKIILHYYELAVTYEERNSGKEDIISAKKYLKIALDMPSITPDDPETKRKAEELLKKLN